jgi:hypothetical protein
MHQHHLCHRTLAPETVLIESRSAKKICAENLVLDKSPAPAAWNLVSRQKQDY